MADSGTGAESLQEGLLGTGSGEASDEEMGQEGWGSENSENGGKWCEKSRYM